VARLSVTYITEAAIHQARQKLAEAEQKNERASAALIEALATVKATIDEANSQTKNTDTSDLLINLLTEEEVKEARQNAADYAKRLLADLDAARDEMHARFVKAIAADENAN
jgi:predicted PhzF superfamily epimerase YddE/YHI9